MKKKKPEFDPHSAQGKDYVPFIHVHQIPSLGVCSRVVSWTVGRTHHLLSSLELQWFYIFDFTPQVIDIREQYRLPLEETLAVANDLGLRHPRRGDWHTMTTDFVLTLVDKSEVAVAVKYEIDAVKKDVQEKLRIEQEHWARHKIPWRIATEKQVPRDLVSNVAWIHTMRNAEFDPDEKRSAAEAIKRLLNGGYTLRQSTAITEERLCLPPGFGMSLVRHLLATREWVTNMMVKIDPRKPLKI